MQKRQRPKSRKKQFPGGLQPPGNCLPVSVALREHGLHENAVALLGAVDQHMRDRADESAVLQNGVLI